MTTDTVTEISALVDHENTTLDISDLDAECIEWLRKINTMSIAFTDLEVPDPVDVDALITDVIEEIKADRVDRFIRFMTADLF